MRIGMSSSNTSTARPGALGVPTPANDFIYACLKPWANGTATA